MNWVTCTLVSTNQVKNYNMDLCKSTEDRSSACVLEFIDGEKVVVKGSAASIFEQMMNNQQALKWEGVTA